MNFNKDFTAQQKKQNGPYSQMRHERTNSLLINSELQLNQSFSSQSSDQILKKVSQIIIALHSSLVPKTQNVQIYRDLTQSQQKLLNIVGKNNILHPILAGVLAIDSCLKAIQKQQNYLTNNVMKGITICLGNYKKASDQFLQLNNGKASQNFAKFYDSLKYIVNQVHKMPNAKIKKSQIDKHNQFLISEQFSQSLKQLHTREQNIILSLFEQQNRQSQKKIKFLQQKNRQLIMQLQRIHELQNSGVRSSQKLKRLNSDKDINTEVCSSNGTIHPRQRQQLLLLRQQLNQKSDIILKMNEQFSAQIQKYKVVFKRLEQQNKLLKKYNDLDTAFILEELQFQVNRLRQEKRNDQQIIGQIQAKIDYMSWNNNNSSMSGGNSFTLNHGPYDNVYQKGNKNNIGYYLPENLPFQNQNSFKNRMTKRSRIASRNCSPQNIRRNNESPNPNINTFYSPGYQQRQRQIQRQQNNYFGYQKSSSPSRYANKNLRNYSNSTSNLNKNNLPFHINGGNNPKSKQRQRERQNSPNFGRSSREVFQNENKFTNKIPKQQVICMKKLQYQQSRGSHNPNHNHNITSSYLNLGNYQKQQIQVDPSSIYSSDLSSLNPQFNRNNLKNNSNMNYFQTASQHSHQRQRSNQIYPNQMRKSKYLLQHHQRLQQQQY